MKINSPTYHIWIFIIVVITIIIMSSAGWSATYYVSTGGNDKNPGNFNSPFRTIQKGLDTVRSGDTCMIRAGTYYESLILNTSGTSDSRITLTNYNGETVTINSGNKKALKVKNLDIDYYTIEGLRFISIYPGGGELYASVDFQGGWNSYKTVSSGNDFIIFKNNYVQGSLRFYGNNCIADNNEIYGNGRTFITGIGDGDSTSYDNQYTNNIVHSFGGRGIWTWRGTKNHTISGNTVYDCHNMGIDTDGARYRVIGHQVFDNTIFKIKGGQGVGILLENSFDHSIYNNIMYDLGNEGIQVFTYGRGCGFSSDDEYRDNQLNTDIYNNLIYDVASDIKGGIVIYSSRGLDIYNNTIYNASNSAVTLIEHCGYQVQDTKIINNIMSNNKRGLTRNGSTQNLTIDSNIFYNSPNSFSTGTNAITDDPKFVSAATYDFSLQAISPAINSGVAINKLTHDIEYSSRPSDDHYDIGAYEYVGQNIPPTTDLPPLPPQNLRIIN